MEPAKLKTLVKGKDGRYGKVMRVDVLQGAYVKWYEGKPIATWVGWADLQPMIKNITSTDHSTTEIK